MRMNKQEQTPNLLEELSINLQYFGTNIGHRHHRRFNIAESKIKFQLGKIVRRSFETNYYFF